MGAIATLARINSTHFVDANIVKRITQITRIVIGTTMASRFGGATAFVFARPVDVIAQGQLDLFADFRDGFSTRSRTGTLYLIAT